MKEQIRNLSCKGVDVLVKRLRDIREKLIGLVSKLSVEELNLVICGDWTVKDVLGHIASWREAELQIIKEALKEKPKFSFYFKSKEDLDKWNQDQVEKKRGLTLKEVIRELESINEEFIGFLEKLGDEKLYYKFKPPWQGETTIKGCVEVEIKHEQHHLNKIAEKTGRQVN